MKPKHNKAGPGSCPELDTRGRRGWAAAPTQDQPEAKSSRLVEATSFLPSPTELPSKQSSNAEWEGSSLPDSPQPAPHPPLQGPLCWARPRSLLNDLYSQIQLLALHPNLSELCCLDATRHRLEPSGFQQTPSCAAWKPRGTSLSNLVWHINIKQTLT